MLPFNQTGYPLTSQQTNQPINQLTNQPHSEIVTASTRQ